jgi:uncharacterized membrane protein YgcG
MVGIAYEAIVLMAWMAMVHLAFAGGMSHLLPTALFASTLEAVTGNSGPIPASLAPELYASGDPQGLAQLPINASSSSSIRRNHPGVSGPFDSFADLYTTVQIECYMLVLGSAVLLAASMFIVVYVEVMLVRVHSWLLQVVDTMPILVPTKGLPDMSLVSTLVPSARQGWRQLLPTSKHLWLSMDVDKWDIIYTVSSFMSCNSLATHYCTGYPVWVHAGIFVAYFYAVSRSVDRHRQKARLAGALWLATQLLCSFIDFHRLLPQTLSQAVTDFHKLLPLPASAPKAMLLLAVWSCLGPKPSKDPLHVTLKAVVYCMLYAAWWVFAWLLMAWRMMAMGFRFLQFVYNCTPVKATLTMLEDIFEIYLGMPSRVVYRVMSDACSAVFDKCSGWMSWLLVCLGAAEISAVSAVSRWYKHLRRIWRRADGRIGAFVWQLLHGEDAGQGSRGSRGSNGGRGSKGGSKQGSKATTARRANRSSGGGGCTAGLQETASHEVQLLGATSIDTGHTNSSSSSSSSDDDDDEVLALLTLLPTASANKGKGNNKRFKPQPANKGKQRSTQAAVATAAARGKQPIAAAVAAKPSLASSSNNGRPAAMSTGKGSAAISSQALAPEETAAGETGLSQLNVFVQA